ncbi:MAG TPA: endonuclease III [Pontiellaceae bacterium]|nr:endonuclease III [Pontiellaceae bacterium]HPR82986.1 endonuclease III [Pontiellaceae bacterium]
MKTKKARADFIGKRLEELYPKVEVPLKHTDAYTLLVAVILSAQCTDKRVNEVTPALFAKAGTPQEMVQLGQEKIRSLITTCGLANNKSRAIYEMSKILVAEHGGRVPDSFAALEKLPGVGHKTASVIMAQAFGVPAFPVDTHIHRLAQRWKLTSGKSVEQTEADLKKLFPPERWNKLHIQLILYGREHCTARGCDGTRCEICRTLFPDRTQPVKSRK